MFEDWVGFLVGEDVEAAEEGETGVDEGSELARPDHEVLALDLAAGFFGGLAFGGGGGFLGFFDGLSELAFRGDLGGEETAAAEFVDGVVLATGLDGTGGFLSSGIDGDVFKFGHGVGA